MDNGHDGPDGRLAAWSPRYVAARFIFLPFCVSTVHLDGKLDDVPYDGRYRMIDVYRDSGNGWTAALSAAQLTSAPQ